MNENDCFYSTEIREWNCCYTGCEYNEYEVYPPSCIGKCDKYISYEEARKIVK